MADIVEELSADAFLHGHLAPITAANTIMQIDPTDEAPITWKGSRTQEFIVHVEGRTPPKTGSTIRVVPGTADIHLFDATTGTRLSDRSRGATGFRSPRTAGRVRDPVRPLSEAPDLDQSQHLAEPDRSP